MARGLSEELNLTTEQLGEFEALLETYRERFAAQAERREAEDEERAALLRQLRDAQNGGNAAKVQELEGELAARRDEDLMLLSAFLAELDDFLTDNQRTIVEHYRDRNAVPGGDVADVRTVLRAARRLRLEPDQRERLRTIERDTIAAFRELKKDDATEEPACVTDEGAIAALLTDEQKAQFEQRLTRGGAR